MPHRDVATFWGAVVPLPTPGTPYRELAAASGLEVGDRVEVFRQWEHGENGVTLWHHRFSPTGTVTVIKSIGNEGFISTEDCGAAQPYFVFRKVRNNPPDNSMSTIDYNKHFFPERIVIDGVLLGGSKHKRYEFGVRIKTESGRVTCRIGHSDDFSTMITYYGRLGKKYKTGARLKRAVWRAVKKSGLKPVGWVAREPQTAVSYPCDYCRKRFWTVNLTNSLCRRCTMKFTIKCDLCGTNALKLETHSILQHAPFLPDDCDPAPTNSILGVVWYRKTVQVCGQCDEQIHSCTTCRNLYKGSECPRCLDNADLGECAICENRRIVWPFRDIKICFPCRDSNTGKCNRCRKRFYWQYRDQVTFHRSAGFGVYCGSCSIDSWRCSCGLYWLVRPKFNPVLIEGELNSGRCPECQADGDERDGLGVKSYSFRPRTRYMGTDQPLDGLRLGFENEIISDDVSQLAETVQRDNRIIYAKEDSSLGAGGIEFISHPMTLKYIHDNADDLKVMMREIRKSGSADDVSNCGMHVHMSRSAITDLDLYKLLGFIYQRRNRAFITAIGGRGPVKASSYMPDEVTNGSTVDKKKAARLALKKVSPGDRAVALNITPEHTVEMRLFQGTVRFSTLMKNLEFAHASVMFVKASTAKYGDLVEDKFRKFVRADDYPHLYKFLDKLDTKTHIETIKHENKCPECPECPECGGSDCGECGNCGRAYCDCTC